MIAENVIRPLISIRSGGAARERGVRRRRESQFLVSGLVLLDGLMITLAIVVTTALRLVLDGLLPVVALGLPERHVFASILTAPVLLGLFWFNSLYDADGILAGSREYGRIAHAVTYGVLFVLGASYFVGDGPLVSRSWLLLLWVSTIVLVSVGRFAARRIVRQLRRHGMLRTRVVVVGASSLGVAIATQLRAAENEGLDVVGFLDEYIPLGEKLVGSAAVIGRPGDLVRGKLNPSVDEYLLVPQALPHERLEEITRLMVSRSGPTLRMAVSSNDLLTHGVLVAQRASVPLVTMKRARITGIDAVLKRTLDLVGATIALIGLGPVAMIFAAYARLRTHRSGLVYQAVRGECGGTTGFLLFDESTVGWAPLRGVPALLAVLSGRLSLVGPRPVMLDVERLARTGNQPLTAVKPGLTGPWRLSGPDATLSDQALRDLAYVRDYTIWEDLRIVAQSVWMLRANRSKPLLARWHARAA